MTYGNPPDPAPQWGPQWGPQQAQPEPPPMPWPGPATGGPTGGPGGPPAPRRGALWIAFGAGVVAVALAAGLVVALVPGKKAAPTAAASGQHTATASSLPASPASAQPSASSSGSSDGGSQAPPPCPSSPVTGPQHTLDFPKSIGGYDQALSIASATATPENGTGLCSEPDRRASYTNSANDFFDVYAGYHGNGWTSYDTFWESFNAGAKITMFPAGPLGGQVGCLKLSSGAICTWFDNDTFGEVVGGDSESHTAAELTAFRAAIEHKG